MNPLRTLETTLASLVEGAFGRVFRSEVRPMELARKLAREMDEHRTTSVSRVYAPNEYAVWLSPEDRARYEGVEDDLIEELCAYLLEHARGEQLTLVSHPVVAFHTDEELSLGEFGIQARLVRPEEHEEAGGRAGVEPGRERPDPSDWMAPVAPAPAPRPESAPRPAPAPARAAGQGHGQTMIFSGSRRLREPLEARPNAPRAARAMLLLDGRRVLVAPVGALVGRSRECDVALDDAGVSRRHAQIRSGPDGWTIEDLHSTNGVRVNGRQVRGVQPLADGDRIALGSTEMIFELR
ncbi:MAG TPA: DUF3662 and FHA domain-containing protein [Solirubrobacteraceae bacterium]|nr:DUF3662 and FHA domain-containing protein [Solirubrobacteraceae bacterium]